MVLLADVAVAISLSVHVEDPAAAADVFTDTGTDDFDTVVATVWKTVLLAGVVAATSLSVHVELPTAAADVFTSVGTDFDTVVARVWKIVPLAGVAAAAWLSVHVEVLVARSAWLRHSNGVIEGEEFTYARWVPATSSARAPFTANPPSRKPAPKMLKNCIVDARVFCFAEREERDRGDERAPRMLVLTTGVR